MQYAYSGYFAMHLQSQCEGSDIISATSDCDKSSILSWRATTTDPICAEDRDFKRIL